MYFELFDGVMSGAVTDKAIEDNPCDGIKLSQVFRRLSRAPKWVPDEADVPRLFDAVPERYHGLLWLGAGEGLRISEALGFEEGPRCPDESNDELHVVQQLRYSPKEYGGFCLTKPRAAHPAPSTWTPPSLRRCAGMCTTTRRSKSKCRTSHPARRSAAGFRCYNYSR